MSKTTKIWLIIAASLVGIGLVLFAVVMAVNHWDFSKLSTAKFETNTYEIREEFNSISMKTQTADILFAPSDDGMCKVVCYELENAKHSAVVQDGTLTVNVADERKWYEHIGIWLGAPKITVYLPKTEYDGLLINENTGDIEIPKDFTFASVDISTSTGTVRDYASVSERMKIKTSTGDIRVENVSAGAMDLCVSTGEVIAKSITCEGDIEIKVSTGQAKLTDVACSGLVSNGSTGRISLENVTAANRLFIERSTGDVELEKCDAAELFIKTNTGDVTGSLRTDKVFISQSDTGRVDVPKTITGGRCEIATHTGDIRMKIE